jgi:feruloyl esterase
MYDSGGGASWLVRRLCGAALACVLALAAMACGGTQRVEGQPGPVPCEQLTALLLPGTTITAAESVAAGGFAPPATGRGGGAGAPQFGDLPAFCRVTADVAWSQENPVTIEVWLPASGWDGDFQPAASGFAGGRIGYGGMASILRAGRATANTNRGHEGGGPWNVTYMGHEPYHLMVDRAKAIIAAFYGMAPQFTFMDECGGGGTRDALMLVQHWPEDLDAAVAVGFVYHSTRHGIAQAWVHQATNKDAASYIPPSKYPLIHRGALDACDARDGVVDGVIEDPPRCEFDPGVLLCRGGDRPDCLTAPQVEAVRKIYSPVVHSRTGEYLFAPMTRGSELRWEDMAGPSPYPYVVPFYRSMVFRDQGWQYDPAAINFDTHVDLAEAPENRPIDATSGDLRGFVANGGKLLLIGGWNDHTLAPGSFVDHYEAVVAEMGEEAIRDSVRLFMVPGMDHCLGRDYAQRGYEVDTVGILRDWKATGIAPTSLVMDHFLDGQPAGRRLVCPYPQIASYNGTGSTDDPASFSCRLP